MNRKVFIVTGVVLCAFPALGALRFGLGGAVAKESAKLIDKAGAANPIVGDNVAFTLPACSPGASLDSLPTDMSMIGGVDPLGHVQPTGHTFPSDHIYYYSSTMTVYTPPVYAPADIHITRIAVTRYPNAPTPFEDYAVYFYPCRNIRAWYGHVRTLSSSLMTQLNASPQSCTTYSTGGSTFEGCNADTNFTASSGELIGFVAPGSTLDFGASDDRVTVPYVSPSRRGPYQLHTVCPIDYFTAGPKATMEAKLGRFDGGYPRTTPPICGTIAQDVANTAKGYWYHPGSPDNPEDPHLSLIDNNAYAPKQTISVGNSLPNGGGMWVIFSTTTSGLIDRDFSQVTADGNTYCYDSFLDPIGQPASPGYIFILKMPSSATLQFEKLPVFDCSGGPGSWNFSANAVTFQR